MRIRVAEKIDPRTRDAVWEGLRAYNARFAQRNQRDFTVTVSEGRAIIGGAIGESKFDWLIVQHLWVADGSRGKGLGSVLMAKVEALARKRRCVGIHLDTFSFQAPAFYRKLGFKRFGRIADHPRGHSRIYLYKRLLD
jgi:GNAT superfamily N-acetyltransferase